MSDPRAIKWMVAAILAVVVVVVIAMLAADADKEEARGEYLEQCINRDENLMDPAAAARGVRGTYQCGDGNQIKRDSDGRWRITPSTR